MNDKQQILEAGLRGEQVLLSGIVIPGEMDERSVPLSLVLSTNKELDLMIERDAKGDELMDHLRELIRVKGFIRVDHSGKLIIRITDYEIP